MNGLEYDLATTTMDFNDAGYAALGGVVAGMVTSVMLITMLISLAILVLTIIANWKIFTKAGQAGWKSIIPIYNMVILYKVAGISPWWLLLYLTAFIPVVGTVISVGLTIYLMINLAKAFGKGSGFMVGLILLNTIFMMILAFGESEYQLNKNKIEAEVEEE